MKIWKSFSGDHSAKLKIVGEFKTRQDAEEAAEYFNRLIHVEDKDRSSDELKEFFKKYGYAAFNYEDPKQMDYFYEVEPKGNKIIVETDELEIQAIIKIFIDHEAKIEILSRHHYPDEY